MQARPVATVGFLHTADAHVPTYGELLRELAPGADGIHLVDRGLLDDAGDARMRLAGRVEELAARGAAVVLCTSAALGRPAELLASPMLPVLRVDRPVAEEAVRLAAGRGGRIGVVAAVEATFEPIRRLLLAGARAAGVKVQLIELDCTRAWPLLQAGQRRDYLGAVVEDTRRVAAATDVLVLAQSSMADAEALLADLPVPVLSSPRPAVRAAARMLAARAGRPPT